MTECFINVSSSEDSEVNQVNDMSMDISITSRSSELNLTSVSTKKSKLKTRRLSYTIQFRLEAIEWHKNNGNNQSETARQYGTSRQNIALWLQNEDKYCNLLDNKSVSVKTRRRLLKPRIGKFPEMESKLIEWFTKTRNDKLFVTYELLISKALEIFNEINTNKRETVGLEKSDSLLFKASTGWVQGFMQRYQLSVRAVTTIGQKIPKNAREISFCFFQNVDNFRSQQLLQNNQIIIINMDEIPVYFDLPQNHTIDKIGNKSVALRTTGPMRRLD
ncbi:tigger transposable element-derived protein 4-like, partial [Oppia nitens]|uniref:tigger transposable element-derived protein 4-like n=1 Tax=Oppia nitens TaxID=1686743 RepID=UPI0023DCCD55